MGANTIAIHKGASTVIDGAALQPAQSAVVQLAETGQRDHASKMTADTDTDAGEITVTGSRLTRARGSGAQEVGVYTREQIERSGRGTVSDFLNTLSAVSVASSGSASQSFSGITTVQLRGLPIGTTLVLINGRRVEQSGSSMQAGGAPLFDLNNIPVSLVERIEVVSQGGSAIYGSDAIAGVVNIILRSDFDGFEANARYGSADDTNESSADVALGKRWSRGAVSLVGNFMERNPYRGVDRALTANADYRRFGATDLNVYTCERANLFFPSGFSFNGQPPVQYAAVPIGLSGTPTAASFASTAGTLNRCSPYGYSNLIPATERKGVMAAGNYQLFSSVELFLEQIYSKTFQSHRLGQVTLAGTPVSQTYTVPASNPFNPFGVTVGISGMLTGLNRRADLDTEFVRSLVGAKGALNKDWNWELTAGVSQDKSRSTNVDLVGIPSAIPTALNSTGVSRQG